MSLKQERGLTSVHCSWDSVTRKTKGTNGAREVLDIYLPGIQPDKGAGSQGKQILRLDEGMGG